MSESGASSDSDESSSGSSAARPPPAQRGGTAKKKPAATATPAAAGAAKKKGKLTPSEKELGGRQQAPRRAGNLTMEKLRKDPKAIFILVLACESQSVRVYPPAPTHYPPPPD